MERRLDLFVLMRNASRLAPEEAYSLASLQLQHLLGRAEATFQVRTSAGRMHQAQTRRCHQGSLAMGTSLCGCNF